MLKPLSPERWNEVSAAHLLNRAGFGGTPRQVEALAGLGLNAAVSRLLEGDGADFSPNPPACSQADPERRERLSRMRNASEEERRQMRQAEQRRQRELVEELRVWWLDRMVRSPRPLEEKLVLFWHGHFATSVQKVKHAGLMYRQLELFRRLGLGRWRDLLIAVTRDPAMLLWLDQAQSRRAHPNENYAREVMELFALGEGNYTEKDVTETARALTGLSLDRVTMEPVWLPREHDTGLKTILGSTEDFGPDEVIARIAEHPKSAHHMAGRLWRFFAQDPAPAEVVEGLARVWTSSQGDIRRVLTELFRSEAFYDPAVVRTQIKSPVQWLVCAFRQLERPLPPGRPALGALRELGQDLLAPPNVKGWDGGVAWISTATLTRRQQLAAVLTDGRAAIVEMAEGERGRRLRARMQNRANAGPPRGQAVETLFSPDDRKDVARLKTALAKRFLQSPMRRSLAADVDEALGDDAIPEPGAIRAAVRVVLQATDYQLT